jgi:hypothetical protein
MVSLSADQKANLKEILKCYDARCVVVVGVGVVVVVVIAVVATPVVVVESCLSFFFSRFRKDNSFVISQILPELYYLGSITTAVILDENTAYGVD